MSEDNKFKVKAHRYTVAAGQPFDPTENFAVGPSNWQYRYGTRKRFFAVFDNGREGVVWQDETTFKVFLTWFAADLTSIDSQKELATGGVAKPVLEAAVGNGQGLIAFILVGQGSAGDKVTKNYCRGIKVDAGGNRLKIKDYETNIEGLNIYEFFQSGESTCYSMLPL